MNARDDQVTTADHPESLAAAKGSDTRARLELAGDVRLANRYRIVRLLGQGSMGVVYEAIDEARSGLHVALKLLVSHRPNALYRLKNEFRALAETVHPNLVGLHGLGVDTRGWFVVMDLIATSTDFLSYVRGADNAGFDEPRLRSALTQLLRGVSALHAAGKLHRDLKPRNVLVAPDGRVVIADFGLIGDRETDETGLGYTTRDAFVGTPAYAAPEQARGEVLDAKADLYAVGVMLFEALTGRLPIEDDSTDRLLERKQRESAPDLASLSTDLPTDLSTLCGALLRRDPARRPDTEAVMATLGMELVEQTHRVRFVGRARELSLLQQTAQRARQGSPLLALLRGPSGMGKSALLARFVEQQRRQLGPVVLTGRCHFQEHVPYKAFDSLIDGLGHYLSRLPTVDAASLMPRDVTLLARLFPTLSRVPSVLLMPQSLLRETDESLLRTRAFAALKELLARIADRAPLVICFDDLQWSDQDSLDLLRELMRMPLAPACLFVCAFRSDEPRASELTRLLRGQDHECVELALSPLDVRESSELMRESLGDVSADELSVVLREAAGSPFLLCEVARAARSAGRLRGVHDAVSTRIAELLPEARCLLELACVAGRPLPVSVALEAAQINARALPALLASSLLRTGVEAGEEYLESYHDRIRETVLAGLNEARGRALHGQLAQVLARVASPDADQVATHYRAAGRHDEAAPYVVLAAERASRAFAFGRAAELYEIALVRAEAAAVPALSRALADAYASSGRIVEAAEHYEQVAAHSAGSEERRELNSKAMVLHLLAGQVDRGVSLLDRLCRELGIMPMPHRPWLAKLMQLFLALRYLLGGRIPALPVPRASRHHAHSQQALALCVRATRGFAHLSLDYGSYFALRALLSTRRHRDVSVWPIALAWDVALRSAFHGRSRGPDERDMARAIELAETRQDDEALAIVLSTEGARCYANGEFSRGVSAFVRAEQVIAARGGSLSPIFNGARSGRLACWLATGEMAQVIASHDPWLAEAEAQHDPLSELLVRVLGSYRWLALDRPDQVASAVAPLYTPLGRRTPLGADAWWAGDVALYQGDTAGALAAVQGARRSPSFRTMQRTPSHRAWHALYEGRANLAAHRLGTVVRVQRQLERERYRPAAPMAALLAAGVALQRGRLELAEAELTRALSGFEQAEMRLHAAAMQHHLGVLLGGDLGASRRQAAHAAALEQGVVNPEHWFRFLLPCAVHS